MILVNNYCNLNCHYCFEGVHLNKQEYVTDSVISYILKNIKLNNDITFTGGEPLLSFNKIQKVCDYLESKKINANFSIVTNGLNIDDIVLNYLNKHKFEIQILLDGALPQNNNRNDRTNVNIEKKILSNINKIIKIYKSMKLTLRINFSRNNLNTYKKRIDLLLDYFGNDLDKINFDFKLVDLPFEDEQYLSQIDRYKAYLKIYEYLHCKKISLPSHFISGGLLYG